jgi:hypothetical protein
LKRTKSVIVYLTISYLFVFCPKVNAQHKSELNISVGISDLPKDYNSQFIQAFGNIYTNMNPSLYPGFEPVSKYISSAYNIAADYNITDRSVLGIAGAYQYTDVYRSSYASSIYTGEDISRTNVSLRYLFSLFGHVVDTNSVFELLIGGRIGVSFWEDIPFNGFVIPNGPTNYIKNYIVPSVQILAVLRVYPFSSLKVNYLKNIGFHLEGGLGSPYFLEAGLTYRIITR